MGRADVGRANVGRVQTALLSGTSVPVVGAKTFWAFGERRIGRRDTTE